MASPAQDRNASFLRILTGYLSVSVYLRAFMLLSEAEQHEGSQTDATQLATKAATAIPLHTCTHTHTWSVRPPTHILCTPDLTASCLFDKLVICTLSNLYLPSSFANANPLASSHPHRQTHTHLPISSPVHPPSPSTFAIYILPQKTFPSSLQD